MITLLSREFWNLIPLHILFLEPYDAGSHRAFREGLCEHSVHDYRCLTLPARFWKWRMRGAAAWFADELIPDRKAGYDLILATDYLNLADLRGLLPAPLDRLPAVLYMHENQLTYPLSPEEEFDFHFGYTNILSALAATRVIFNSDFHRDLFLESIPSYLGKMPEAVPRRVPERLAARSTVLPVGLQREPHPEPDPAPWLGGPCAAEAGPGWPRGRRPTILWNHRWEFDKRPDLFRAAIESLLDAGLEFDLLLLGEPRGHESFFEPLRERLGPRLRAFGHVPDRVDYDRLVASADIVVSCAAQEYFGISVAEAIHAGAYAVLPREQVYPSLYGSRCRGDHFYTSAEELKALLARLLAGEGTGHVCGLPPACDEFCWRRLAPRYDEELSVVVAAAATAPDAPSGEDSSHADDR